MVFIYTESNTIYQSSIKKNILNKVQVLQKKEKLLEPYSNAFEDSEDSRFYSISILLYSRDYTKLERYMKLLA